MAGKLKRLYLGRMEAPERYMLSRAKKGWSPKFGFEIDKNFLKGFCVEDFERVTGVSLKPGELRRVNINVEIID